jgi:hypothetical protein
MASGWYISITCGPCVTVLAGRGVSWHIGFTERRMCVLTHGWGTAQCSLFRQSAQLPHDQLADLLTCCILDS